MTRDHAQETFPPPLYLREHHAGGAPPSLTLPSRLSHPLIHLPPLCCVSPSHSPPFAPSNYNSIHQSFAVTMATAMLCTGRHVVCGHLSATGYHRLLHKIKLTNQFCITPRGMDLWKRTGEFFKTLDSITDLLQSQLKLKRTATLFSSSVAKGSPITQYWELKTSNRPQNTYTLSLGKKNSTGDNTWKIDLSPLLGVLDPSIHCVR